MPFSSSSSPEITWKKDGKPIDETSKRLKFESNDFLTQLSYEKCERTDTATYTIKVAVLQSVTKCFKISIFLEVRGKVGLLMPLDEFFYVYTRIMNEDSAVLEFFV